MGELHSVEGASRNRRTFGNHQRLALEIAFNDQLSPGAAITAIRLIALNQWPPRWDQLVDITGSKGTAHRHLILFRTAGLIGPSNRRS